MFNGEDFITVKGVTLSRELSGEKNLWVKLFLKGEGIVSLTSKNFMGDSEPFLWANYDLQRKSKSRNYFVADIDVRDDMLSIRRSRETIKTALKWTELLTKYLPQEQPDDDLLSNLYWNMKLLATPSVPYYVPAWRFLWKWLELWGLAPELVDFHASKNFNHDEILLLSQVSILDTKGVIDLFTQPTSSTIRENAFIIAAKLAVKFLNET
ncbi:MAG: DNA repair protein RecO C-terminal domain-containing protein [Synergistaceae bacterium]|nr:DNA repair protein RecO C-terminal domain-containing protein [Synergistaceae bacterium]